ncbi:MAG: hypothetical protein ACI8XO_003679 [Verrucomicrobiales bacterium]
MNINQPQGSKNNMMKQHTNHALATLVLFVALALGLHPAAAQDEEPKPITRVLAAKLIADFYEIGTSEVKVAYILHGKLRKEGFEADRAAEVTFIRPVVSEGRRRRAVHSIRFQHDDQLGWFLKAVVEQNGRTYIDICSETEGRIRIE